MAEIIQGAPPSENGAAPAASAPVEAQPIVLDANNLSPQQRVAVLKSVHAFFSNYDRVPGGLAGQWGSCLDALGIVINSLNTEIAKSAKEAAAAQ